MRIHVLVCLLVGAAVAACGPSDRGNGNGDGTVDADTGSAGDDAPVTECVPSVEVCNDSQDNDCDLRVDCGDTDCSGIGDCPVCGSVENPEATPLPLPDGISSGAMCSTDAQCTTAEAPNCVAKECHASYSSILNFVGFPVDATLDDPSKLLKVCVNMEHSYLRDLQIELITPNGTTFALHKFIDRMGGEIYLGQANETGETAAMPVPGVGFTYCWTAMAPLNTLEAPAPSVGGHATLPAGDYKPFMPWSALFGSPLNGMWEMRVTDLWGIDNGFMFSWSIAFDPTLVEDCAGPIIE